jgi:hypothetical protein
MQPSERFLHVNRQRELNFCGEADFMDTYQMLFDSRAEEAELGMIMSTSMIGAGA